MCRGRTPAPPLSPAFAMCSSRQGTLVLSAYKHSLLTRCFSQKEGMHDGGIPFFRFTKSEMRETLGAQFDVHSITGLLVYLYLARCTRPS